MPFADAVQPRDDASELSPSGPYRALKQAGLVVLCTAWVVLGLFGRDPWKTEDATSFGIAFDMLRSGDWIVPQLTGGALPERAPLFYALAAGSASAFQSILPLHDAARVAIAICLGITLWLLALTGRELYGKGFRWLPVLIFIGCIGLWDRAHQLSPDLGLLPALALALYAFALSRRRPSLAGFLLGAAAGLAFLFRGSIGAVLVALIALLLPLFKAWRSTRYAATLAVALVVAAPLIVAWPLALYWHDPAAFSQWFAAQNLARFFGLAADAPESEPLYYAKNLLWFAWPALPLAFWTLWLRSRGFNGGLSDPGIELPAAMSVVLLIFLSAAAEPRATLLLPLLLPLSLLAAAEVDTLKRGYSGALDWFGILTFGLLAAMVWALWIETLVHGLPEPVARVFHDTQPGYQPPWQTLPVMVSVLLSLFWLALVRPARRSHRRAVLNWAVGMTLVWGLYTTIWLPYLDSRRSYRSVAESLAVHLPARSCVAGRNLGEAQRALLEYFIGLVTVRDDTPAAAGCTALLVQVARDESADPPDSAWTKAWEGRRRGDDTERFILFVRNSAGSR